MLCVYGILTNPALSRAWKRGRKTKTKTINSFTSDLVIKITSFSSWASAVAVIVDVVFITPLRYSAVSVLLVIVDDGFLQKFSVQHKTGQHTKESSNINHRYYLSGQKSVVKWNEMNTRSSERKKSHRENNKFYCNHIQSRTKQLILVSAYICIRKYSFSFYFSFGFVFVRCLHYFSALQSHFFDFSQVSSSPCQNYVGYWIREIYAIFAPQCSVNVKVKSFRTNWNFRKVCCSVFVFIHSFIRFVNFCCGSEENGCENALITLLICNKEKYV